MNNSAKLDIILGPMFSGKTTKLLEIMDAFEKKMLNILQLNQRLIIDILILIIIILFHTI